jgi:hypothetical protein
MQRRKFIAGVGSLAAGAAAVTGTGAFTSVSADRSLTVAVTGDASAFLGISKAEEGGSDTPNAQEYVEINNGKITLDFSNSNATGGSASGVNKDAKTLFDNLLDITNNGTQTVNVFVPESELEGGDDSGRGQLGIYYENTQDGDGDNGSLDAPGYSSVPGSGGVELAPGKSVTNIGVYVPAGADFSKFTGSEPAFTFKAIREGGNRD